MKRSALTDRQWPSGLALEERLQGKWLVSSDWQQPVGRVLSGCSEFAVGLVEWKWYKWPAEIREEGWRKRWKEKQECGGGTTTSGKNQTKLTECFCRCSGGIFPGCSQPAPVANKKLHACTFNSELGHIINYVNVAEDSEDCCKFLTLSPLSDLMSSTVRTVSYSTALPTVLVLSVLVATCMPSQTHIIS